MLRLLSIASLCVAFLTTSFVSARVTSIPGQIANSWWLSSKEASSIFNGSKDLNVKFDNSKPIVIAILDTGIDFSHPYLKEHEYIPKSGTAHFNFYTGTNQAKDLMDIAGHGTHVAGIVLATIQKANPQANVKFISLKILPDPKPERSSMAVPKVSPNVVRHVSGNIGLYLKEASSYLVKLKKEGVNVLALNASYGGYTYDQNEKEALAFLSRNDILVAAAAGNDAKKLTKVEFTFKDEQGKNIKCIAYSKEKPCPAKIFKNFYPAAYNAELDNIIAVGNVNRNGLLGKSSNFGSSVDIFAPGEDIVSSTPGGEYELKTGTSMATPQVTASLALLKSAHPTKTNLEIKSILLDNSIFNDYYVDKSSSASRLNIPYLFKKKSTQYSVKSLMKLNPKSFTNDSAKITRDVPCMMSPSNKILCGPEIYRTKLYVNGKEQSIAEVLGAKNIERQKAMNLGLLNKGQIIESSLNMTIKSISKNEKIFQLMLKHGFAFSDLYHSLGKEFLNKNYAAQVIVPVLSYSEFKENYPPGTRVNRELYAKYIKDIVNTPPQFLNRFKSVYLPRPAPDLNVEIGLTKIFPLPLTENLISFIAKNKSPDADVVLKRLPDSFVNRTKDKEVILRVKDLKENTPVIALTKKDLKYLDGFNQVDTKADALISSRLSGSGYRPASKESFEGIKKAFKSAIPIEKVSGIDIKGLDSNKEIQLPNKILNRLESMETALLAVSLNNQKKLAMRVSKAAPISKKGKKVLYQALKKNALVLNKDQELQLDPLKVRANIFRPGAKAQERIGESEQEYFRMLLDRSLAGDSSQKRGVASGNGYTFVDTKKKKIVATAKPNTHDRTQDTVDKKQESKENEIHGLVNTKTVVGLKNYEDQVTETNENFSCDIRKVDILRKNLETLKNTRGKSSFVQSVFCEGNSGISSQSSQWQRRLTVMQYFNRCVGSNENKPFVEILAGGIQASGCKANNIELSCKDNLVNQIISACEKINWHKERPIGMGDKVISNRMVEYIMSCRTNAVRQLDLFSGYQKKDHREVFEIKNLKRVLEIECGNKELVQSKKRIEAAFFHIHQKELRDSGKNITFKSINLKEKFCGNAIKLATERHTEQDENIDPIEKLSYSIVHKNLPSAGKLISNWSAKEAAAFLLFNESALSIGDELKFCTSSKGTGDGLTGAGNVK